MNLPYSRIQTDFNRKHILIFGLGTLGRGIGDTIFFAELGCPITVTDLKTEEQLATSLEQIENHLKEISPKPSIRYSLGAHHEADFVQADVVIKNAGIHKNSPWLQMAQSLRKPVYMDESLFSAYCPAKTIGITGTRGKTTTTHLVCDIASFSGHQIHRGGNLQGMCTLPLLKIVQPDDLVVMELSSWQLQGFSDQRLSPHISVYTNLYPDHLNYYPSMAEYDWDKRAIYRFQSKSDHIILNANDPKTPEWKQEATSQVHLFHPDQIPPDWVLPIPGEHNRENIAAALQVGRLISVPEESLRKAVESFQGVEHRFERVATIRGTTFINDTTATTPTAVVKALQSLSQPSHLIAGGADKNLDPTEMLLEIQKNPWIRSVWLLAGSGTPLFIQRLTEILPPSTPIHGPFSSMEELLNALIPHTQPDETVLLSPGFASFGIFVNEFDRGNRFKQWVYSNFL